MIKLVLPLTEACLAMEMISCCSDRNKLKQSTLVLLMKSGNLCLFDDSDIERYLLQCQSKSCPSLPTPILVKLPYVDSSITVAKLYTGNPSPSSPTVEVLVLIQPIITKYMEVQDSIPSVLTTIFLLLCRIISS